MANPQQIDFSNGYEAVSEEFTSRRTRSPIGVAIVREWAQTLPPGAVVLDLGCGHGVPIAQALIDDGLAVYGVDASPSMIAAFRARFPNAATECSPVEHSQFFSRTFDGLVAWGLMFLLTPDAQRDLIYKLSAVLEAGGRFLFTSPHQASEWSDILTGRKSVSLGSAAYRRILDASGMIVEKEDDDEGENHYYFARKAGRGEGAAARALKKQPFERK